MSTMENTEEKEPAKLLYDMSKISNPLKLTASGHFLYLISDNIVCDFFTLCKDNQTSPLNKAAR